MIFARQRGSRQPGALKLARCRRPPRNRAKSQAGRRSERRAFRGAGKPERSGGAGATSEDGGGGAPAGESGHLADPSADRREAGTKSRTAGGTPDNDGEGRGPGAAGAATRRHRRAPARRKPPKRERSDRPPPRGGGGATTGADIPQAKRPPSLSRKPRLTPPQPRDRRERGKASRARPAPREARGKGQGPPGDRPGPFPAIAKTRSLDNKKT